LRGCSGGSDSGIKYRTMSLRENVIIPDEEEMMLRILLQKEDEDDEDWEEWEDEWLDDEDWEDYDEDEDWEEEWIVEDYDEDEDDWDE